MKYDLQVIIATGAEDPCRARLGFETAIAAAASDLNVVVFLSTRAVMWGTRCKSLRLGCGMDTMYREIRESIDLLLESGGRIEVCSACVKDGCSLGTTSESVIEEAKLHEGLVLGGLTTVAVRATETQTVTF